MNRSTVRRLAAPLALVLAFAACGGNDTADDAADTVGDEDAADAATDDTTDEATDEAAADGTATPVEGPESTVSPEVPDAFLPAVGPMDVAGDHLPRLESDDIDADPAVGTAAPVVVGLDFDGNPQRIDAISDGPTMVVVLAHWCPHCNNEIPVLNDLRDQGLLPADLNVVGLSTGPDPDAPNFPPGEWLDDLDWTWPAIADGVDMEAGVFMGAEALGVSAFPFTVLIDGDGDVVARWAGAREPESIISEIEGRL